jgi:NADPH2 dehydrogenase
VIHCRSLFPDERVLAVPEFKKMTQYRSAEELAARFQELGWSIPCDPRILTAAEGSPLGRPIELSGRSVGNRWCIHPMEGWDGTLDGRPSEWTRRRWTNFGRSGAKLIWGGEAVAVRNDGRANPNQLLLTADTQGEIAALREVLAKAHQERFGSADDLVIGIQLTHSGRYSRPDADGRPKPRIAYHHPILDARLGIAPDDDAPVFTDDELRRLRDDYVEAARRSAECGFDFVDLKCCHGYLGHELLGAHVRPGPYGGSFENRTRFIRELVARVRQEAPGIGIGVRLSAFDLVPFEDDPKTRVGSKKGVGMPCRFEHLLPYRYGFGVNTKDPLQPDLEEAGRLLELLTAEGVAAFNITAGSPYYNPHIQRPAMYPPSDGYLPPEDPLAGVARHIEAVRQLKLRCPAAPLVGTAYTYLQEFLPLVAQATVGQGWVDWVGVGRMVLSYPELPADCLDRGTLDGRRLCRTFSDCTTAPRKGLVSGCYPLDPAYKSSEAAEKLRELKRR